MDNRQLGRCLVATDEKKTAANYYLTQEALDLVDALALRLGIAKSAVIEIAVRELGGKYEVEVIRARGK